MGIKFNDFLDDIKKGAGVVKRSYKNVGANLSQKRKFKKEIDNKAIKEGEKIFMKNNPKMAMKDGSFPQAGPNMPSAYNKEAGRIQRQVRKTRKKQAKKKGII